MLFKELKDLKFEASTRCAAGSCVSRVTMGFLMALSGPAPVDVRLVVGACVSPVFEHSSVHAHLEMRICVHMGVQVRIVPGTNVKAVDFLWVRYRH